MKFISLKIKSEFRNLEGLRLSLSEKNDTYVLIGNNGTGKTNILEALSSVFYSLLFKETFEFSFVLLYKLDDDSYRISHQRWYTPIVSYATIVGKILAFGKTTTRNLTIPI